MTSWEREFLQSIRQFFIKTARLSHAQKEALQRISSKYSEEALEKARNWEDNWSEEQRTTARRVAYYYEKNPPYFSSTVSVIMSDPDGFILSKSQWDKFCENKFAKRIRAEYARPAKFLKNECVKVRLNNRLDIANYYSENNPFYNKAASREVGNRIGFIMATDALPITRASKSSRIYRVLLAGSVKPVYAHESDLKKVKLKNEN